MPVYAKLNANFVVAYGKVLSEYFTAANTIVVLITAAEQIRINKYVHL
jgi:hypothetical protein